MRMIGTVYAIIAIVMWGALALLAKKTAEIPPFQLLAMCFFIAASILPVTRFFAGKTVFIKPTLTWLDSAIGIGALLGFHGFYFMALQFAPAIEVSLIGYLWPMLLALLVAPQGMRIQAIVGGSFGLVAVSIVLGWTNISLGSDHVVGYLLAFGCALIWAFYSWYLSRAQSSANNMSWLCLGVAIGALIISLLTERWDTVIESELAFYILLLGLGPVGGAFYLWELGLKLGNQSLISALSFSTPLISAILLALFGLVSWSDNLVLSLVLLVGASVIINIKRPSKTLKILP